MPTSTDYSSRPLTHQNNGGEDQPVDVETQRFTEKPSGPKLRSDPTKLNALKNRIVKNKFGVGLVKSARTMQNFDEWIPEMVTDEFMSSAKKNGFHYAYNYGSSMSTHSYGNSSFFVNEISKQQYIGFHALSKADFEKLSTFSSVSAPSDVGYYNNPFKTLPNGKYVKTYRGVYGSVDMPISKLIDGYFGIQKMDNILMPGMYGDGIYTSGSASTARSYSGNNGTNTRNRFVIRMLISSEADVMTEKERTSALKYLQSHEKEFKESVKRTAASRSSNVGYDSGDIDKLADLIYNSLTHTETAIPVALGKDVYLNQHILVLNGRHVYAEKESYDALRY